MPDRREIDALIERAIRSGVEVTIVTIGGRATMASAEQTGEKAAQPVGLVVDPIILIDPVEGLVLEANAAFHAWSALPSDHLAQSLTRLDPQGRLIALARRAIEIGEPASVQLTLQGARGRASMNAVAVPISGEGRSLAQLVLREAPFLGAAENELRRALLRLTEILDALPTPLLTLDRSGRIRTANPAAESLLRRRAEGLEIEAIAAPVSAQRLRELVAATPSVERAQSGEIVLTVDQEPVPAEITMVAAGEGDDLILIAVLRDLRPEREADLARAQLLGRQHQMQKLEAIGRLAGGIAADVNNILASILGYADLALDDLPPGTKGRDSVEQVLKAGRRGKELVRQIVALGRGEPRPERRIRLDELLRTTMDVLRPIVPEKITLEPRVAAPTAAVMGDAAELHQVLLNLCRNAVQAIGDREGRIEVILEAVEISPGFAEQPIEPDEDAAILAARAEEAASETSARPARIFAGRLSAGPYVRITVGDTGEGMPASVLSRIFEPFFTTRKVGEASGLGLAVVHGIVTAQGGGILASSTPGHGTRVEVYFPRSHRATELLAQEIDPDHAGARVLLTGPAAEKLAPLRRVLEAAGLAVESVAGGRAALEAFRADAGRWRLAVLLDGGEDVAAESLRLEIFRIRPDLPIILCSELGKTLTLDRLRAVGMTEIVSTPVDPGELAIAVERALRSGARRI
ncbi:MAG TPA: ATP-binding protein [Alphaproteobacteria bacterium]|nr:ATP-binding protein [Alphaproteobacteria bacterium]